MPREERLRCDSVKPPCQNSGTEYLISSERGGAREVILCAEHAQPLLEILKLSRPGSARRRRPAKSTGTSRDRLAEIHVDE